MKIFSSGSPILQQWCSRFSAPVVVTLATEEAERVCMANGLLVHELLSAFGQLDGISVNLRVPHSNGSPTIPLSDICVRFERGSEVRAKEAEDVERCLVSSFRPFPLSRLPTTAAECHVSHPTAWTRSAEELVTRSMGFSEYELQSHPVAILCVVSTTDLDPVAAITELFAVRHTPMGLTDGLYDPSIPRIFVLLDDVGERQAVAAADPTRRKVEPLSILREMSTKVPQQSTRLLSINSFAPSQPNLQQPDLWSQTLSPLYFLDEVPVFGPQVGHMVQVDEFGSEMPPLVAGGSDEIVALTGGTLGLTPGQRRVFGARLSVEDSMKLREFCVWLFQEQIVPCLERRLTSLSRQVNDSRKGVKNVFKSFWRRPREDTPTTSGSGASGGTGASSSNRGVKYRYDKIESLTLALADLSFQVGDYETALANYRLVREDFRADKSTLHLAHVLLMTALSYLLLDPSGTRYTKDISSALEGICQCMTVGFQEAPHAYAYFALLASEIHNVSIFATRSPLDAAKTLLQAASCLVRYPMLASLLTERAALQFLSVGQIRKFVLHLVLAGGKLHRLGGEAAVHATVCYATALLQVENSSWGDLKAKLFRSLAQDLKTTAAILKNSNGSRDISAAAALGVSTALAGHAIGQSGGLVVVPVNGLSTAQSAAIRSLVLMLRMLVAVMDENKEVGAVAAMVEAVSVFNEISRGMGDWGQIALGTGWREMSVRDLLLGTLPVTVLPKDSVSTDTGTQGNYVLVTDIPLPTVDPMSIQLLEPLNGRLAAAASTDGDAAMAERDRLLALLLAECEWAEAQRQAGNQLTKESLAAVLAKVEFDLSQRRAANANGNQGGGLVPPLRVPLGEELHVRVKLTNQSPVDLRLSRLRLSCATQSTSSDPAFNIVESTLSLSREESSTINLSVVPTALGAASVTALQWQLSPQFAMETPLKKIAPLLHKTRDQRVYRIRADGSSGDGNGEFCSDTPGVNAVLAAAGGDQTIAGGGDGSLRFQVVRAAPLLEVELVGLPTEVLRGELLSVSVVLRNVGTANATSIRLKVSEPLFVFLRSDVQASEGSAQAMDFVGPSLSVLELPGMVVAPGESARLAVWLRVISPGLQRLAVLAAYEAPLPTECTPADRFVRSSIVTAETRVVPSLAVDLRVVPGASSTDVATLVTEVTNLVRHSPTASATSNTLPRAPGVNTDSTITGDQSIQGVDDILSVENALLRKQAVDVNCLRVSAFAMSGTAVPFSYSRSPLSPTNNRHMNAASLHASNTPPSASVQSPETALAVTQGSFDTQVVVAPDERIVQCFSMQLTSTQSKALSPAAVMSSSKDNGKFLTADMSPSSTNEETCLSTAADRPLEWFVQASADENAAFIRRFIQSPGAALHTCLSLVTGSAQFSAAMVAARTALELDTVADPGPRSIAAVRRERAALLSQKESEMQTISLDNETIAGETTGSDKTSEEAPLQIRVHEQPPTLDGMLLWMCWWRGQLCWGTYVLPKVRIEAQSTTATNNPSGSPRVGTSNPIVPLSVSSDEALESLLFSISHVPQLNLMSGKNSVDVVVTLRSLSRSPLQVSLAALSFDSDMRPIRDGFIQVTSMMSAVWTGKTAFEKITLLPFAEVTFRFVAQISVPGVIDLNRFIVRAEFVTPSASGASASRNGKTWCGASLLVVE